MRKRGTRKETVKDKRTEEETERKDKKRRRGE